MPLVIVFMIHFLSIEINDVAIYIPSVCLLSTIKKTLGVNVTRLIRSVYYTCIWKLVSPILISR